MWEAIGNIESTSRILLICWIVFLASCIWAYFRKPGIFPYFLFFSAVCIAAAFAAFSPYLYAWDEQFHALVARNLAQDPAVPKLFPHHPLNVAQNTWSSGIIWLHKQPLFTWQMALSIKFFGANAFAIRLPSVLFHGALVVAVYRIGTIAFNPKTGFIASLLVMHSAYLLGLISGRISTDHNDFIFLCYVTFSFWAWFEWNLTANKKWLYWIGIFVGCAILTKWLVGLLVFAGWGILIIPELSKKGRWTVIKPVLISFGISLLVSMPWQIYAYIRFPEAFKREMLYNSQHITHTIENHVGDSWYHFNQISSIYFTKWDFLIVFLIGTILLIIAKKVRKDHTVFVLVSIAIIYLFFSLVQTKMPSFTIPVFGLVTLVVAFGLTEITKFIPVQWLQRTTLLVLTLLMINWFLKPAPTLANYGFHSPAQEDIAGRKHMMKVYQFMTESRSKAEKRVVFGVDFFPFSHISWMFYNDRDIAYPFLPNENQVMELTEKGYDVLIIRNPELAKPDAELFHAN